MYTAVGHSAGEGFAEPCGDIGGAGYQVWSTVGVELHDEGQRRQQRIRVGDRRRCHVSRPAGERVTQRLPEFEKSASLEAVEWFPAAQQRTVAKPTRRSGDRVKFVAAYVCHAVRRERPFIYGVDEVHQHGCVGWYPLAYHDTSVTF